MPYEIHIRRITPSGGGRPISREEWHAAVEKTGGVRLAEGPLTATNPKTGEVISIANSGGDAEVFFPDEQQWFRVFHWSPSGISFAARREFHELPFHGLVLELARCLNASAVGDEGKIYG